MELSAAISAATQSTIAMNADSAASVASSTSRVSGLGIEREARLWQDAVVEWPTPLLESKKP